MVISISSPIKIPVRVRKGTSRLCISHGTHEVVNWLSSVG